MQLGGIFLALLVCLAVTSSSAGGDSLLSKHPGKARHPEGIIPPLVSPLALDERSNALGLFAMEGISYLGSLEHLRGALQKALVANKLKIGIAGGSVSTGSGCDVEKSMWFNHMVEILEDYFGSRSEVRMESTVDVMLNNIAQGATGPQRVVYCGAELLREEVDVIILEYAINDSGSTWSELLVRQFLLSKKSAVIFLETFVPANFGSGSAQMYHDALARHYDIPIISARDALSFKFRKSKALQDEWFSSDNHHPSCIGHEYLGGLAARLLVLTLETIPLTKEVSHSKKSKSLGMGDIPMLSSVSHVLETSASPTCILASETLLQHASVPWGKSGNSRKPTFDCSSTDDGDVTLDLNCSNAIHQGKRDFCQIVIIHTKSWQPMGDAAVYLGENAEPSIILHSFSPEWRENGIEITVQHMEGLDDPALRIRDGSTSLRIHCLGSSLAHKNITGFYDRNLFQLHGFVLI